MRSPKGRWDLICEFYITSEIGEDWEAELGIEYASFDRVLEESDFITLHVPKPETHHLIGKAEFEKMKSTAILVNIARGPVVDSAALYDALKTGEIPRCIERWLSAIQSGRFWSSYPVVYYTDGNRRECECRHQSTSR